MTKPAAAQASPSVAPAVHVGPTSAAAYIHMQGRTLEVVSEVLVTSYHFKTGKPYQFIACSVRDERGKP